MDSEGFSPIDGYHLRLPPTQGAEFELLPGYSGAKWKLLYTVVCGAAEASSMSLLIFLLCLRKVT